MGNDYPSLASFDVAHSEIASCLANGHSHIERLRTLNVAFGQTTRYALASWGVAPGYGD
jgi:hypothetical protein